MAAKVRLKEQEYQLGEGESVLDRLDREGVPVLSSCRSGVCQTCLMKALDGPIPSKAQVGLKDSLKAQDYFLSCVCYPEEDMTVALPGEGLDHRCEVLESHDVGAAVRCLRLSIPKDFTWFAGQYITVIREDAVARSYSVASSPEDGYLELHVRRIPGGALSNWFHDDLRAGSQLTIRGAFGDCIYTPDDEDAPLLLAGTGTGLAPLYGVLRDALRNGHRGEIHLFHGALNPDGLYFVNELNILANDERVIYHRCVLNGDGADYDVGALDAIVLNHPIDLDKTRAYLCGDPGIVGKMRKKLFLKGLSNRRIFADAFVPTATGGK